MDQPSTPIPGPPGGWVPRASQDPRVLDKFLQQLQEEGVLCESGAFTIDRVRRSKKLFSLQVKWPFLYLQKLIQAAVAAGSRRVAIRFDRKQISLEFGAPQLSAEALTELLETGKGARSGWCRHLELAALLLPLVDSRSFELTVSDRSASVRYSPQGIVRGPRAHERSLSLILHRPSSGWWKVWEATKFELAFNQFLVQRLSLCPLEIVLNGRWLNQGVPESAIEPAVPQPRAGWAGVLVRLGQPDSQKGLVQAPISRRSSFLRFRDSEPRGWGERIPTRNPWEECLSMITLMQAGQPISCESGPLLRPFDSAERLRDFLHDKCRTLIQLLWVRFGDSLTLKANTAKGLNPYRPEDFPDSVLTVDGLRLHSPPLAFECLALLPWLPIGPCKIFPLLDGALMEPVEVHRGLPGAAVVVASSQWEADVSQTRTVAGPILEESTDWAVEAWELLLKEIQDIVYCASDAATASIPEPTRRLWSEYFEL